MSDRLKQIIYSATIYIYIHIYIYSVYSFMAHMNELENFIITNLTLYRLSAFRRKEKFEPFRLENTSNITNEYDSLANFSC